MGEDRDRMGWESATEVRVRGRQRRWSVRVVSEEGDKVRDVRCRNHDDGTTRRGRRGCVECIDQGEQVVGVTYVSNRLCGACFVWRESGGNGGGGREKGGEGWEDKDLMRRKEKREVHVAAEELVRRIYRKPSIR